MNKRFKKGRLTLHTFYPITKYMGAFLIALSYPRLNTSTWLMPDITGPRALMMLWTAFLLGICIWMDASYARAEKKDLEEMQQVIIGLSNDIDALRQRGGKRIADGQ